MVSETTATVAVLVVANVLSRTVPTKVLLLRFPLGVNNNLHAHPIQIVLFVLVEYLEPRPLSLSSIGHAKEEPL